jgi:hypothetical protein
MQNTSLSFVSHDWLVVDIAIFDKGDRVWGDPSAPIEGSSWTLPL